MLVYRLLQRVLGLAIRVFFRRIAVVGLEHVPPEGEGPVIFCGNHPNSLLDPLLITVTCGRIVHFAAKDVLFRSRLLRFFLRILGAVPVQRRKDHAEGRLSNEMAFERLFGVLAAGRTMGIFPEGLSHDSAQLARLKTGAARIALGAAARHEGLGVRIIPCGLHYLTRDRFRSSVLIQYGEPIEVGEAWLEAYRDEDRAMVRRLTREIESRLRGLTVNAADWETLKVLDGVRRLYQPRRISIEERVELARRFTSEYPRVKDVPEVVTLVARVEDYQDRLEALGLSDRDLRRDIGVPEAIWMAIRHFFLLLVWLPLAAVGGIVHLPVALLLGWGGERFAPRKDVIATTKFVAGFLTLLLLYAAVPILIAVRYHLVYGLIVLLAFPLTGYATLRVLERAVAIKRVFVTSTRMLSLGREIRHLRGERHALEAAVVAAVNRYKPADMELMFPRDTLGPEDVP